jgi:predicted N-formylglutamate amidohydrolase
MQKIKFIISCEHASNTIPNQYKNLFKNKAVLLRSHRAYDAGALDIARSLNSAIGDFFIAGEYSRLLIDLNRSMNNKHLFSFRPDLLSKEHCKKIITRYYLPYHQALQNKIDSFIAAGHTVFHLSIHTFTPVYKGKKRTAEVGILYDPSRQSERVAAYVLKKSFQRYFAGVRLNYPYKGISDGTTKILRGRFSGPLYNGFELEFNQRLFSRLNGTRLCIQAAHDSLASLRG